MVLAVVPAVDRRARAVPQPHAVRPRHPGGRRQPRRRRAGGHLRQAGLDARVGARRRARRRSPPCSSTRSGARSSASRQTALGPGLLLRALAAGADRPACRRCRWPSPAASAIGVVEALLFVNVDDPGAADAIAVRRSSSCSCCVRGRTARRRVDARASSLDAVAAAGARRARRHRAGAAPVAVRPSACRLAVAVALPLVVHQRRRSSSCSAACCSSRSSPCRSPCSPAGRASSRSASSRSSASASMATAALVDRGMPFARGRRLRRRCGRRVAGARRRRPRAAGARACSSPSPRWRSRSRPASWLFDQRRVHRRPEHRRQRAPRHVVRPSTSPRSAPTTTSASSCSSVVVRRRGAAAPHRHRPQRSIAVRDNEDAAAVASRVSPAVAKLTAFALSRRPRRVWPAALLAGLRVQFGADGVRPRASRCRSSPWPSSAGSARSPAPSSARSTSSGCRRCSATPRGRAAHQRRRAARAAAVPARRAGSARRTARATRWSRRWPRRVEAAAGAGRRRGARQPVRVDAVDAAVDRTPLRAPDDPCAVGRRRSSVALRRAHRRSTTSSVEARPGEIVGLIGANGAGKSTLHERHRRLRAAPTPARSSSSASDVTDLAAHQRARLGMGRVFQDARLFGDLTVRETVQVALEAQRAHRARAVAARPAAVAAGRAAQGGRGRRAHRLPRPRPLRRRVHRRRCRPAPAASSSWRACSPRTRACCCSTSRPPASPSARPRRSAR